MQTRIEDSAQHTKQLLAVSQKLIVHLKVSLNLQMRILFMLQKG